MTKTKTGEQPHIWLFSDSEVSITCMETVKDKQSWIPVKLERADFNQ